MSAMSALSALSFNCAASMAAAQGWTTEKGGLLTAADVERVQSIYMKVMATSLTVAANSASTLKYWWTGTTLTCRWVLLTELPVYLLYIPPPHLLTFLYNDTFIYLLHHGQGRQ